MAVNPMQRRIRNSIIIGVVIGLVVAAIVAGVLVLQINKLNDQIKLEESKKVGVFVTNKDIAANNEITAIDITNVQINTTLSHDKVVGMDHINGTTPLTKPTTSGYTKVVPSKSKKTGYETSVNAKTVKLSTNSIVTTNTNNNVDQNATTSNETNVANSTNNANNSNNTSNASSQNNTSADSGKNKIYAKVAIPAGTIITKDMVSEVKADESNKATFNSLRLVEVDTVVLPSELKDGDTVDIRISYPNGMDEIVIAKKVIEKADATTAWMKLDEAEILTLSSATVESMLTEGTKLYALNLTDPGLQNKLMANYRVNDAVAKLIKANQNLTGHSIKAVDLEGKLLSGDTEELGSKLEAAIKARKDKRKTYFESVSSSAATTTTTR